MFIVVLTHDKGGVETFATLEALFDSYPLLNTSSIKFSIYKEKKQYVGEGVTIARLPIQRKSKV